MDLCEAEIESALVLSVSCRRRSGDIHLFAEDVLEHVDRLSGQHRDDLVLVVNCQQEDYISSSLFRRPGCRRDVLTVTTVLLCVLVRGVFDLDRDTGTDLVLLDNLLGFVVDLERRAAFAGEYTSDST